MQAVKFVHWQEQGFWLGYLQDYPDYLTQAETLEELRDNLQDLYLDLMSGAIPGIRKPCATDSPCGGGDRYARLLHLLERDIWPSVPSGELGVPAISKAEQEEMLGLGPEGV